MNRITRFLRATFVAVGVATFSSDIACAETPYVAAWSRQMGTTSDEWARSVGVDSAGNAYVTGYTGGSLYGSNLGNDDLVLTKYDSAGNAVWSRQAGTSGYDAGYSVTVDETGNSYVTGHTYGSFGGPNIGGRDIVLAKYDSSGNQAWSKQLGTPALENGHSVALDSSRNIYIGGATNGALGGTNVGQYDATLIKCDSSGNMLWARQFGTSANDHILSVAADSSGNAYVGGLTDGGLFASNAGWADNFLAKYDSSGNRLWSRQFGTPSNDRIESMATDTAGNVYVSGSTGGNLFGPGAGNWDAFLAKYSTSGNLLWSRQLGTAGADWGHALAVDAAGNAYLSGETDGDLGGAVGSSDVFLAKYDAAGNIVWTQQIGTTEYDQGLSIALGPSDSAYVCGATSGSLGGDHVWGRDMFLTKFAVPEPSTLALLATCGLALIAFARGKKKFTDSKATITRQR
jgi:hypothetical protein